MCYVLAIHIEKPLTLFYYIDNIKGKTAQN